MTEGDEEKWGWARNGGMTWWVATEQFISFVLAVERLPPSIIIRSWALFFFLPCVASILFGNQVE